MKICSLYIVWYDGIEILPFSIAAIDGLVDEAIIIYSRTSNFGVTYDYLDEINNLGTCIKWEPDLSKPTAVNELNKRNFGLEIARARGFTHFIMMDCDEIYDPDQFLTAKWQMNKNDDLLGMVCPIKVYVKEPTLCCDDHTLVPFIQRIGPQLRFSFGNKIYPFAYDQQGNAHIDPTRRLNIGRGVLMSHATMHHFSHVRRDIHLKMANSTARSNLTQSTLLKDYENAKPGYYSEFYRQTLIEVPNRFNIVL